MTSNFAADLGQSSGGMITMATKSGTTQYHGGAWEYLRNDAFDANTFFANLNGRNKPELRYNTFGFNFGGPVPKIGHEKKTFFFYNMEWRRLVQGGEINAVAVPRAMTTGDFSSLSSPIHVPNTTRSGCNRQVRSVWADARPELPQQYRSRPVCSIQTPTALLTGRPVPGA